MTTRTLVPVTNTTNIAPGITTFCPPDSPFGRTGISIDVIGKCGNGIYSCQLDDNPPQWFNANFANFTYKNGCSISGIAAKKTHKLRVSSGPLSGWWLAVANLTVTTGDTVTNPQNFTSGWPSYQLPSNLAVSQSTTAQVPVSTLAAVAATLGALFIGATVAAVYFWVRDSRFRRDHQWSQRLDSEPVAYLMGPATESTAIISTTTPEQTIDPQYLPPYGAPQKLRYS
ncbi:hypothetical protein FRB90_010591 [Tulasnella sp. 427]|nr:hypothetical protein FRB90_010591 [Tulasnella sp. 427]